MTLNETIRRLAHYEPRSKETLAERLTQAYNEKYNGSMTTDAANFNDGYLAALEWVMGLRDRDSL